LEARRFLLDFFFLAVVVVVATLDCCGLGAGEAMLARFSNLGADAGVAADAEYTYTRDTKTSDAAIGSLLIFPRISSRLRAAGFQERSVGRG
jgi:hypothetical protein